MEFVSLEIKIIRGKTIQFGHVLSEAKFRKRQWFEQKLLGKLFHVIEVNVRVAANVNKLFSREVANVRHQMREQRIAGDVERQTQTNISAALIHLTGELSVLHVKLGQAMARRNSHFWEVYGIPRGK